MYLIGFFLVQNNSRETLDVDCIKFIGCGIHFCDNYGLIAFVFLSKLKKIRIINK